MKKIPNVFVTILVVGVLLIIGIFIYNPKTNNMNEANQNLSGSLKITSPVFKDKMEIPAKYTCDGENINPPFNISGVPSLAKSLVLIVDDPDAPSGTWIHWLVWNIRPDLKEIPEKAGSVGIQGNNTRGVASYGGPCPPAGTHRYFFKLFALDEVLNLKEGSPFQELNKAMDGHVIDYSELIGLYSRK